MKVYIFLLILIISATAFNAQERRLVWADEFNESIDYSIWDFDTGPSNDNVHYYTNRPQNIQVVDSVLNIIALEESYMGFNYTSALLKTKIGWRYGRIEARINLPETKGFVPAFWMLPIDNTYGWWPNSGEIDIMEQPSNESSNIYGTVHTKTYNYFTGTSPVGSTTIVPDAQTNFHVYAIEWTEDKIDFYVDDLNYFTFNNDGGDSKTWPFNRPFQLILNLAVGGGWSGNPDSTTVFPAVMEIDYVRVYQYFDDIAVNGEDYIPYHSSDISYSTSNLEGASYNWELPGNAQIISGQGTNQIGVDWNYFGGDVKVDVTSTEGSQSLIYPVRVSENLLKNPGFETGVKYWNGNVGFPAVADFNLDTNTVFFGDQSLSIDITSLGANPWDIQCSQRNLILETGEEYNLSFWAKTGNPTADINVTLISFNPFVIYKAQQFQLSNEWTKYELNYSAAASDSVDIYIDLGFQTGKIYLDNFLFTSPELQKVNQIINADFMDADSNWDFMTLSQAQAAGSILNGEYEVSISNGGNNVWDIHLGQTGMNFTNGLEYSISFDAYSISSRTITPIAGKNSEPWTIYHNPQQFTLTTNKKTYSYSFIMTDPTDTQSRFGFDIGGSAVDVYFDNIRVSSGTIPTSVSEESSTPQSFELFQNYPNPFNPTTLIKFNIPNVKTLPSSAGKHATSLQTRIIVYDVLGKEIATLLNEAKKPGTYEIEFDASDLPSGVYFYRLNVAGENSETSFSQTKKMILLR